MKPLFALLLTTTAAFADVRVTMERVLPEPWNKTQHIVQEFEDVEAFEMWMQDRLEGKGCDPYVANIQIDLNWDGETVSAN